MTDLSKASTLELLIALTIRKGVESFTVGEEEGQYRRIVLDGPTCPTFEREERTYPSVVLILPDEAFKCSSPPEGET